MYIVQRQILKVVDNIGNPTGYPVNKLGKGYYAICIEYMLQSARGEYIAQNATGFV